MFVQIIQGKAKDADGLRRQYDRWQEELASGAKGYLGSTGGVAEDGTSIMLVRFENEAAAKANSDRAEQGDWWNETAKYYDGDVTFRDSSDTDTSLGGGSDEAGFVQVMQGEVKDRQRLSELEAIVMPQMSTARPDVLGSVRAWEGNSFTEAIYFSSEAEARKGEANTPPDLGPEFEEMMSLSGDIAFIDLKDPWLHTA